MVKNTGRYQRLNTFVLSLYSDTSTDRAKNPVSA